MLRTVTVGGYQFIQGVFVRTLANGLTVVRVGKQEYTGKPVEKFEVAA